MVYFCQSKYPSASIYWQPFVYSHVLHRNRRFWQLRLRQNTGGECLLPSCRLLKVAYFECQCLLFRNLTIILKSDNLNQRFIIVSAIPMILQPYFNYVLIPFLVPHLKEPPFQPLGQQQEEQTEKIFIEPKQPESSKLSDLHKFVFETGNISKKHTSTKYMRLSPPYSNFRVLGYPEFEKFYAGVVEKYENFYGQDKKKKSWGKNDISILIWIVHRLSFASMLNPKDFSEANWAKVSSLIPFRNPEQCKFKWLSMRRNQLQSNPWSNSQIETLLNLVKQSMGGDEENAPDWGEISHEMFARFGVFRTSKQCRQCWNIQVKSHHQSKKLWTKEEDEILLDHYKDHGRRWKLISANLPGRSQNAIKNRFNLLSSRGVENEIQEKVQDNSSTLKSED